MTTFQTDQLPLVCDDELLRLDEATWPVSSAACLSADPELFFSENPADLELAKLVCEPCPLRQRCLEGALERQEPHGVWGGQILADGVVIARKRPRGRPRKHPAPEPSAELAPRSGRGPAQLQTEAA